METNTRNSPVVVMVAAFELRQTKTQTNFGSFRLSLGQDGEFAQVDGVKWDIDRAVAAGQRLPTPGDVLELIDFQVSDYQGRQQYKLGRYRIIEGPERAALLDLFSQPEKIDRTFYTERLEWMIEQTDINRVSGILLREIFDRAGFREAFFRAPAAKVHHQNYPGGLLEHTLNVTSLALALADTYGADGRPGLTFNRARLPIDRGVLIAAGLLHDIGKIQTYQYTPLPDTTDANVWEGHLVIGYATVREQARPYLDNPPYPGAIDEINKLLHCILAHHGTLEFGSPVTPACAEAFLLAQADMTDARMADIAEAGLEARQRNPDARWLGRQFHFPAGVFIADWPAPGKG